MRPTVVPASTINGGAGLMIASVLAWGLKQFAHIEMPTEVALNVGGLLVLGIMHFTQDTPPRQEAQDAVDVVADKAEKKAELIKGAKT